MDERSERGHDALEIPNHRENHSHAVSSRLNDDHRADDPVLKALDTAPWALISEDERETLYECERNAGRRIPASEFMEYVDSLRHEHGNVDD